jgi:acetyl esterase
MFEDGFYLTRTSMKWFTDCYLRTDSDRSDPRVSPLLAEDVSQLPPAWVMTAGCDPLRDEGAAYAQKLAAAGVAVKHDTYPGLFHGVISMTGVIPAARAALTDGIAELAKHMHA